MFNHLNECNGVQHMFDIGKLAPLLFTNNLIDHELDLRSTRIHLVQMNTQITDRHKNWNILPFKEAIKRKRNQTIIIFWFEGIKGITTALENCLSIKYQFICIRILLYFSLVKLIVNVVNITSFSP